MEVKGYTPWAALNGRHTTTDQCANGSEREWRRLAAEEMREITVRAFQAYVRPLNLVTSFNYLSRIIKALVHAWLELVGNLRKVRNSWVQLSRILGREGENPRVSGMFFSLVVQVVLIFGS